MEEKRYSLLGIEMPFEEFDRLICEQNEGKELKVVDGNVVAVERESTAEDIKRNRVAEIKVELDNLSQDFIQVQCGAVFEDLTERKQRFATLHNELRQLLGKEPRVYEGVE